MRESPARLQGLAVSYGAALASRRSRTGGLANDKFGLDGDFGNIFAAFFDKIYDGLRGNLPHAQKWLPHRSQRRICEGSSRSVIEPHHGNVFWHTPQDTLDKLSPKSLEIVGDVALETVRLIDERK